MRYRLTSFCALLVAAAAVISGCGDSDTCTEAHRSGAGWGTYETTCPEAPDAGEEQEE